MLSKPLPPEKKSSNAECIHNKVGTTELCQNTGTKHPGKMTQRENSAICPFATVHVSLLVIQLTVAPHPFLCFPLEMILLTCKRPLEMKINSQEMSSNEARGTRQIGLAITEPEKTLSKRWTLAAGNYNMKTQNLAKQHLPLIYLFLTWSKCECLSQSQNESLSLNLAQIKLENKSNYINYTL